MRIEIGPLRHSGWESEARTGVTIAARSGIRKFARTCIDASRRAHDDDALIEAIKHLGGSFALIVHAGGSLTAAVDQVRSVPLFYAFASDTVYLDDDPAWVAGKLGTTETNRDALSEFVVAGYVTGSETLYKGVLQLEAGTALVCNRHDDRPKVVNYFDWSPCYSTAPSAESVDAGAIEERLEAAVESITDRLIANADGNQIAIPLSGGYDSRLIAASLKAKGYDNILAYTYGRPGSAESEISRDIADRLSIPWVKIGYDSDHWREWFSSDERRAYFQNAHTGTSLPHIQDWPAVWELRNSGRLEDDAVFVPGHSGDFVVGDHMFPQFVPPGRSNPSRLTSLIIARHYSLWPIEYAYGSKAALDRRVTARLGFGLDEVDNHVLLDAGDAFNYRERQAKFITNSVRAYEHWGYQWWLPLWDLDFLEVWQHIPLELRVNTQFYTSYVARKYATLTGLPVSDGYRRDGADGWLASLVASSKRALPPRLKELLIAAMRRAPGGRYTLAHPLGFFGWLDDAFVRENSHATNINSFVLLVFLEEIGLLDEVRGTRHLPELRWAR